MKRLGPLAEATIAGIIAFTLCFIGTADLPVVNGDEARFSQATREMLERGDLVVPTFGGRDRYDKPIVIYWITAASYTVFDVNPRAARLPSNVSAALLAALLAWTARRRAQPGVGLLAALLLMASPVFAAQARACTADLVTMLCTVIALLAFEAILNRGGSWPRALTFWAAMGVAILTKGPVAPLFVGATAAGLWLFQRRWERWQVIVAAVALIAGISTPAGPWVMGALVGWGLVELVRSPRGRGILADLKPISGVALMLAMGLPWAVMAWRATDGAFFQSAVGRHVVERASNALEGHAGFPLFYLATAIALAFPWFAAALTAAGAAWRRRRDDALPAFLLAWSILPMVVLELVQTKLVHYWMPSYPAAILLVVWWLFGADRRPVPRALVGLHFFGGLLLALVPLAVIQILGAHIALRVAAVASAILAASAVGSTIRLRRDPEASLWVGAAASAVGIMVLFGLMLPRMVPEFLGMRTVTTVEMNRADHEAVVIHRLRDEEMLFHLPSVTEVVRSPEALQSRLATREPALIIVRERDVEEMGDWAHELEVLAKVEGIDVGRGKRAKNYVFRLEP
jgi:4-amino-4-deoxy-L-arabinose transferase-like glycosyltransferase